MESTILTDIEQEVYLEPAPQGKRFVNFLVDLIGFYAFIFALAIALGVVSPGTLQALFGEDNNLLFQYLVSYLFYLVYYTIVEGATKGRSLGKIVSGTIAVREDGATLTWKDALLRSLYRVVPFEVFSAFGYLPWHDKWTHTMVIRKSEQPRAILEA